MLCSGTRCFTSIGARLKRRCNGSRRSRRSWLNSDVSEDMALSQEQKIDLARRLTSDLITLIRETRERGMAADPRATLRTRSSGRSSRTVICLRSPSRELLELMIFSARCLGYRTQGTSSGLERQPPRRRLSRTRSRIAIRAEERCRTRRGSEPDALRIRHRNLPPMDSAPGNRGRSCRVLPALWLVAVAKHWHELHPSALLLREDHQRMILVIRFA
jgi:hypothetical protein